MAETKTQSGTTAKAKTNHKRPAGRAKSTVDTTARLSQEVAQSVEDSQRAAIDAVHTFVDAIDHTLPALPHGEGPSRRQEIIDSALEMADRMVHIQYDFVRKAVDSASTAVSSRPTGERERVKP